MMEESGSEDAAASQVEDQLQDAAQTSVTQASSELPEASPPRSSDGDLVAPLTPPTQLPPHLTATPGSLASPGVLASPGAMATPAPFPSVSTYASPSVLSSPAPLMSPITSPLLNPAQPPSGLIIRAQHTAAEQPLIPPMPPLISSVSTPLVPTLATIPSTSSSFVSPMLPVSASSAPVTAPMPLVEGIAALDLSAAGDMSSTMHRPDTPDTPRGEGEGQPEAGGGLFGWFSGGIVNRVMEKTKSSVETMITTLDPGMKEVIYSGGEVDIVVTSEKEVKVSAVRQAFQEVFGKATVTGKASQPSIAPQPVGYTAALKGAEDRINNLRHKSAIHEQQATVSVENFIAELLPDRWFDLGCVVLRDPEHNIELTAYTTAVPVPANYVMSAQDQTPPDYPLRWSGLATTVGQAITQEQPHIDHADWHLALTGVSRRELIYLAAKSLAGMYKHRLPQGGH